MSFFLQERFRVDFDKISDTQGNGVSFRFQCRLSRSSLFTFLLSPQKFILFSFVILYLGFLCPFHFYCSSLTHSLSSALILLFLTQLHTHTHTHTHTPHPPQRKLICGDSLRTLLCLRHRPSSSSSPSCCRVLVIFLIIIVRQWLAASSSSSPSCCSDLIFFVVVCSSCFVIIIVVVVVSPKQQQQRQWQWLWKQLR